MEAPDDSPPAHPLLRVIVLTGTALVVGAVAALAAIALVEVVTALNTWLLVAPRARVQWETQPWVVTGATLAVPTLGGLLVGLAHRYLSPAGRPLGPPDVIRAVQLRTPCPTRAAGWSRRSRRRCRWAPAPRWGSTVRWCIWAR